MIDKNQIRQVMTRASAYPTPVLSLYVSTNPARPDHSPRAVAMRAKSTLRRLAVPGPLANEVVQMVEHDVPRARTLAIFASDDQVDVLRLHMDLPVEDPTTGQFEARWGEPYVLPLLLALDEFEHYGVLHVDRDRWRFFAVSLGAVEELAHGSRSLSPGEWDSLQQATRGEVPYIPARSSGGVQEQAEHHIEDLSRRFYREVAVQLHHILEERELRYLIAMGPERDLARFQDVLPPALAERISATLPALPSSDFSPAEVMAHVADTVRQLKRAREVQLLHDIGERGVRGVDACLAALQRGRLQVLAVPWPLDHEVYHDSDSGFVATSEAAVLAARPNGPNEEKAPSSPADRISLRDALPRLVTAYNTKLEFIQGDHKQQLVEDFGGMGGITRW